jgi:hypothetical protein
LRSSTHFSPLAQAQDDVYQCYATGDPHLYAWHPKALGFQPKDYQDCYMPSFVSLIKNELVDYKVKVVKKLMIEVGIIH